MDPHEEFGRFVLHLKSPYLTVLEIKFIIWRYYCKVPYQELAGLDEKEWSRQYSQQIVKRGINKIKKI